MAVKYDSNDVLPLTDQEVLVSLDPDAKIGDNGLFGPEWHTVGILVDDSELQISRGLDEETVSGKGRGVLARRFKPGDVTGQYEVLSDNEVTDYIAFPDAVVKNNVRLERHTSKVAMLQTAYVNVREDGVIEVRVSRIPATHRIETLGRNETPAGKTVTVGFRPDGDKVIFEKVMFKVQEDGTLVDITPKVIVPQAEITDNEDNYQVGEGNPDGVITPETLEDPQ
ncbi:hypothetical protein ACUY2E_10265 [Corynebacterium confusum]